MNVSVKICGIRSIESALAAIDAGADFIGLNFVPSSKRKVSAGQAKEIIAAIKGQIKIVGVFQNADADSVNQVAETLGLDFVQLHGDEDPAYCARIKTDVIKRVSIKQDLKAFDVPFFLLDREVQGKGKLVDTNAARRIAQEFEIFLAGGLNPKNVAKIVQEVRPFAVDVAGGIETDGKEDFEKMRTFVLHAKSIEL